MPANMFTPRPYQIELVERALKRNSVACLNSTSAKSFIWMTYLREILGNNFRVTREDGKETNAFVLFNLDHLVREYGTCLRTHLDMKVAFLTSDKGLQLSLGDWQDVLSNAKIIVTTPKVLASALLLSLVQCSIIGVMVFDECHTVLEEESDYRKIIQVLQKEDCKPYMLGLTCSLLKEDSSAQQLENDIKAMENLLACKAETATDLISLDGCSPSQPDEKIVLCGLRQTLTTNEGVSDILSPEELREEIRNILIPAIEWLKVCKITSETRITRVVKSHCKENTSGPEERNIKDDDELQHEDKQCNDITQCAASVSDDVRSVTSKPEEDVGIDAFVATSLTVLSEIVLVLDVLGLWCAHKLVILLLKQLQKNIRLQDPIEKCKDDQSRLKCFILRYTDSHLRTVYALCQTHLGNKKKVDLRLVTSKVDRLLQVLKEYKPPAEPDKKSESSKVSRYNDRSETNYVSWWQDSDADEDEEEEQILNRNDGNQWNEQEEESSASTKARQYHHANTLCGIVFVKEKYVALMLQRLLREISKEDSDLWHISSAHITSLAGRDYSSNILEKEEVTQDMYNNATNTEKLKQEEVLRSFRSHEINLLVSTNCLEEYAEIPKCNLVLRFDVPTSYKSYILSKSRVRSTNSTYMMLVHETEKAGFMQRLQEYKTIEKVLQNSTYQLQPPKMAPADFDYLDIKEDDFDEEYERARAPPYYSGPNTCVTLDLAIHYINRYCSRLPSDPFTHLGPRCDVVEIIDADDTDLNNPLYAACLNKTYQGILQLPINAHVPNPIKGVTMSTVLLAQKAVALEACRVLHKAGELDDHFMPIGKEMVKYAEELDVWPEEQSKVPGRPGTTKRRQTYDKEVPSVLCDCLPRPDVPLFLYEIEMKLQTRLPDGLNVRGRILHAPEETTRCFGILSAKPLPSILGFRVFTRSGEEAVRIRLCRAFISLGEQHIKMVRSFHHYIFSDMLRIDRTPLMFCPEVSQMQIFVVVLDESSPNADLDINWRFMCEVASKRRIQDRMSNDPWFRHKLLEVKGGKNLFKFDRPKYEDGVVVAKYRSPDQPNRFYVAEIRDELDPYSSFPSSEYESFHHYYRIKYGLDISCLNQPLLDVDHTSSRLNLLTPRYMNQKGKVLPVSSLEKKRAKYETLTNRQILVPELCDLHPIPASLWRKAVCIPSIIYRLTSILLAEELRQTIYEESGIGQKDLPLGQNWPDLDFGWENHQSEEIESDCSHEAEASHDEISSSSSTSESQSSCQNQSLEENFGDTDINAEMQTVATESLDVVQGNADSIANITTDNVTNTNGNCVKSRALSRRNEEFNFNYDNDDFLNHFTEQNNDEDAENCKAGWSKKPMNGVIEKFSLASIPRKVLHKLSVADDSSGVGPSPGLILQALTLSNASDGFNLERLEMLGDSFLKHAVTVYLFCMYPNAHEGKLSYMRSKKVSNYNLYRIGQQKKLHGKMTALIFDPAVNWLPPGYVIGDGNSQSDDDDLTKKIRGDSLEDEVEIGVWTGVPGQKSFTPKPEEEPEKPQPAKPQSIGASKSPRLDNVEEEDEEEIFDEDEIQMIDNMLGGCLVGGVNGFRGGSHDRRNNGFSSFTGRFVDRNVIVRNERQNLGRRQDEFVIDTWTPVDADGKPLCSTDPLLIDLHTQHSLADKSIADCVEAILGAYLTTCGHRAAQCLLCYFGLRVLPRLQQEQQTSKVPAYGILKLPTNVLLDESPSGYRKLELFTKDLEAFEGKINYTFKNKAYLLQAFTHASYYLNTITDCYQRLEFLGDAILDFLITCHLFNDPVRQHSPGALTDLRSALVNNTIFASLAVRHDFHKYFKVISPELHHIIDGFVRYQHLQEEAQGMDAQLAKRYYPMDADSGIDDLEDIIVPPDAFIDQDDGEEEEEEDVEVPKALGDIFESVAGAIYMDSGMNLDEVWRVYEPMMGPLIKKFSSCVPRAPVRELLEMEPETAKFSWAEKRCDGKVRVTVEVIGKGSFKGVGRSYRIAKSAAARRALRSLKSQSAE